MIRKTYPAEGKVIKPISYKKDSYLKKDLKQDHKDIIDIHYPQILISSQKGTGKTTIVNNLIKYFITKFTNVYIFSTNYMTQEDNKQFVERLQGAGVNITTYTDLSNLTPVLQECAEHYEDLHEPDVEIDSEG